MASATSPMALSPSSASSAATSGTPAAATCAERVVVLGSINVDLMAQAPLKTLDKQQGFLSNQTTPATHMKMNPGGKGANEAVAIARLGVPTTMLGRMGIDDYAKLVRRAMHECGVDVNRLVVDANEETTTGLAIIISSGSVGKITVPFKAANDKVGEEELDRLRNIFRSAKDKGEKLPKFLVMQLEINLEAVEKAVDLAREYNVDVVLKTSPFVPPPKPGDSSTRPPTQPPARQINEATLHSIQYLILNEYEAPDMIHTFGWHTTPFPAPLQTLRQSFDAAEVIYGKLDKKITVVVVSMQGTVTIGANTGKVYVLPAVEAKNVDIVGVADAFTGGLVAGLCHNLQLGHALVWASCCAAICIQTVGAQTAMPNREKLAQFMSERAISVPVPGVNDNPTAVWLEPPKQQPEAVLDVRPDAICKLAGLKPRGLKAQAVNWALRDFQGQNLLHLAICYVDCQTFQTIVRDAAGIKLCEEPSKYGELPAKLAFRLYGLTKADNDAAGAKVQNPKRVLKVMFSVLALLRLIETSDVPDASEHYGLCAVYKDCRALLANEDLRSLLLTLEKAEPPAGDRDKLVYIPAEPTDAAVPLLVAVLLRLCLSDVSAADWVPSIVEKVIVAQLKDSFSAKQCINMLSYRDALGLSVVHIAAEAGCTEFLSLVLSTLQPGATCSKLDLIGIFAKTKGNDTMLHFAARSRVPLAYRLAAKLMSMFHEAVPEAERYPQAPLGANGERVVQTEFDSLLPKNDQNQTPLECAKDYEMRNEIRLAANSSDVFVSYGHKVCDKFVLHLLRRLKEAKLSVWSDHELQEGQPWHDHLQRRLESCRVFLVILSEKWLNSDYCQAESKAIRDCNKGTLIVVAPDILRAVPSELGKSEYDRIQEDKEHKYAEIQGRLRIAGQKQRFNFYPDQQSHDQQITDLIVELKALIDSEQGVSRRMSLLDISPGHALVRYTPGVHCDMFSGIVMQTLPIATVTERAVLEGLAEKLSKLTRPHKPPVFVDPLELHVNEQIDGSKCKYLVSLLDAAQCSAKDVLPALKNFYENVARHKLPHVVLVVVRPPHSVLEAGLRYTLGMTDVKATIVVCDVYERREMFISQEGAVFNEGLRSLLRALHGSLAPPVDPSRPQPTNTSPTKTTTSGQ